MAIKTLGYFTNNEFVQSTTDKFYPVFNPSTGEQIAQMPRCTTAEVSKVIDNAQEAYKKWSRVPVIKRVQVLYKLRDLLVEHMDELTELCATEHGKNWEESKGDILKAKEGTELALSMPSLLQGESLMDASTGYDTVLYRESMGVFVGIAPFNFPAMIPMGWMAPVCIACGNAIVLKVAGATPMTSLRIAELYREAGLPDGVLNIVSCDRNDTQELIEKQVGEREYVFSCRLDVKYLDEKYGLGDLGVVYTLEGDGRAVERHAGSVHKTLSERAGRTAGTAG